MNNNKSILNHLKKYVLIYLLMKNNNDKEMGELFYNMYIGCLKYKIEKENSKKIDCNEYYDQFTFFSEKYINSKEQNN